MGSVEGATVHAGGRSRVELHAAPGAVRFRRAGVDIRACVSNVVDTRRSTTLGVDGARVGQVEHLLAALHLRGHWSDVLVEVSADELPILDGSAREWLALVDELPPPPPAPAPAAPTRSLRVVLGDGRAALRPGPPGLCYAIDFDHPAVGRQRWCGAPERYGELADARTFGFLREYEALRADGLAAGASLENAIVFGDEGPLRPLRSPDEPVRHKALDALGDLFLLGRPIRAHVSFRRGSHRLHVALMRELRKLPRRQVPAA